MLPETEIFYKLKDKTQDKRANLARAIDTYAAIGAIVAVDPKWFVDNYLAIVEFLKEQKLSPEEYFRNTEFPRKELAASAVHPIMESVGVFVYDMHAKLARDPHYLSNLDRLPSMTINLLLSRSAEYMAKFRDFSSSAVSLDGF